VWDTSVVSRHSLKEDPSGVAPQMKDSTVNANHGTTRGGMASADSVEGKIGRALSFDGANDYVETPNIGIVGTVPFSIEFWAKSTSVTMWDCFVSVGSASANDLVGVAQGTTGTLMRLNYWCLTNNIEINISPINHTNWVYVVYTYDGATENLYVNAVLKHTRTISLTIIDNPIRIGGRTGGYNGQYLNGIINEVRISNIARSASWIALQYQSTNDTLLIYGPEETAPI
jgi:hypothetical protein